RLARVIREGRLGAGRRIGRLRVDGRVGSRRVEFVGADVAGRALWTANAPLVGRRAVGAGVDRRAWRGARDERMCLGRSAVVLQRAEAGIGGGDVGVAPVGGVEARSVVVEVVTVRCGEQRVATARNDR